MQEITNESFLRLCDVTQRYKLGRSTIYRLIAKGCFPAPVKLAERASAWRLTEVEAWATERIALSRAIATASSMPAKPVLRDPRQPSCIASEELAG